MSRAVTLISVVVVGLTSWTCAATPSTSPKNQTSSSKPGRCPPARTVSPAAWQMSTPANTDEGSGRAGVLAVFARVMLCAPRVAAAGRRPGRRPTRRR
jgi:hypothetical protein